MQIEYWIMIRFHVKHTQRKTTGRGWDFSLPRPVACRSPGTGRAASTALGTGKMIREWVGGPAPGLVHIFRQDFYILHTTYNALHAEGSNAPKALCMYIIPLQTVYWRFICMFPLFIRAAPPAAAAGYPAKLAIILVLVSQFGYIKLYFFRTHWYAQNWNSK